MIRGLNEVCDKYIRTSEFEKIKSDIAKNKLLSEEVNETYKYSLDTQRGMYLKCTFDDDKCWYSIVSPFIDFQDISSHSSYSSTVAKATSLNKLFDILKEHLRFARKHRICKIGQLNICFYRFNDKYLYMTGVVNNEIVFISQIISVTLEDDGTVPDIDLKLSRAFDIEIEQDYESVIITLDSGYEDCLSIEIYYSDYSINYWRA